MVYIASNPDEYDRTTEEAPEDDIRDCPRVDAHDAMVEFYGNCQWCQGDQVGRYYGPVLDDEG